MIKKVFCKAENCKYERDSPPPKKTSITVLIIVSNFQFVKMKKKIVFSVSVYPFFENGFFTSLDYRMS
jgi:hypothetical protein